MVYSALAAVHRRNVIGSGQWVDVPMYDVMVDFNLIEQLNDFSFVPPLGEAGWHRTIHRARHPHRTEDGWMCILPYTDTDWREFLALTDPSYGEPDADVPLPTLRERNSDVAAMQTIISDYARQHTNDEVVAACRPRGIPVHPVNAIEDLVDDALNIRFCGVHQSCVREPLS